MPTHRGGQLGTAGGDAMLLHDHAAADHAVVGSGQGSQHGCECKDIGAGAVVDELHVDVGSEQIAESGLALPGRVVGAVGDHVSVVGACERFEDRWMGAGGIVAGERTLGCGGEFHVVSLPDAVGPAGGRDGAPSMTP